VNSVSTESVEARPCGRAFYSRKAHRLVTVVTLISPAALLLYASPEKTRVFNVFYCAGFLIK